jgi:hypothetical protein
MEALADADQVSVDLEPQVGRDRQRPLSSLEQHDNRPAACLTFRMSAAGPTHRSAIRLTLFRNFAAQTKREEELSIGRGRPSSASSISSRLRPFVSGTRRIVKANATRVSMA